MTTPMRQQYLALKAQHADTILLFRLGDFYETFDEDAKTVAKVCNVVLTSRPVGNDQRVPLAGVPYHSVDYYIKKLVEAGYRVAIAEQMSEPGKGLVEREITRVVSKGTVVEPKLLDAKRNNYLAAVCASGHGRSAGMAYCDITTGEFAVAQIHGATIEEAERRIGEELGRLHPSELITVDWQPQESSLAPLLRTLSPLLSTVEPWQTAPDTAQELLKRHFRVSTLDGFGLQGKSEAIRAAAAIVAYLKAMQPAALSQLTRLQSYELGEFMTLDESTRRNLELTETIRGGDSQGSLLDVLDKTLTPMGARLLRRWLSQPLLDVAAINRRLDAVQAFFDNTLLRLRVREILRDLGDMERWTNRAVQGVALPRDLAGIKEVLQKLPALRALGEPTDELSLSHPHPLASTIASLLAELPPCSDVLDLLAAALAEDPPATLANPGIIAAGFSGELDTLVEKSRHAKDWIANLERVERERLDIKSLKVAYNKVFGYYIEVTAANLNKVPPEYIRKQTIANGERFITPDLKEYETLVLNADERRLEIEQQLFKQICAKLAGQAEALLRVAAGLAAIDVYASLAEVAIANRYIRPQVDAEATIKILAGRHPVVEQSLRDEPFVPNDTHLTPEAAIHVLTGPNMAGKSTVLRQVALITLLAQIGSFTPAEQAQIGVVDRIFTRIGASDEIHRGQSTFMVEMVETANILHHATNRSLLVLDEIGRGTSTYDGLAIAWAVIEYIHNHPGLRAKTLFATHYHELTDLAERLPHVVNFTVAIDDSGNGQDVIFLRRIIPGKADRSYGIHVGRMAGLPGAVVNRAEEILAELEKSGAAGPRRLFEPETRKGGKTAAVQVGLFAEIHPVVDALRKLDINGLTPLDALNRLYELQKLTK